MVRVNLKFKHFSAAFLSTLELVLEKMGVDGGAIVVFTPALDGILVKRSNHIAGSWQAKPINTAGEDWLNKFQEVASINWLKKEFLYEFEGSLVVILKDKEQCLGALIIWGKHIEYTDIDKANLRLFGELISNLLSSYLEAETYREEVEKLQILLEVGSAISSQLSLKKLLSLIMQEAQEVLKSEASSLMLLDETTGELIFEVALGEAKRKVKQIRIPPGHGIAGWVAQHAKPLLVPDVEKDHRFYSKIDESTGFKTKSILAVPVISKEKVIGVLEVINRSDGGSFSEGDVGLLSALASQAAIAIENARLYRRLEQRVNLANRELIKANKALLAEKSKIQAIVEGIADGIIVVDRQNRVIFINPIAQLLFNLRRDEILGQRINKAFPDYPQIKELADRALAANYSGEAIKAEINILGDFRIVLDAQATPLYDAKGRSIGAVIVLSDITTLKELSDLKTEFVSYVGHELRTPLTSIKGFVQTLQLDTEGFYDDVMRKEFYQIITTECDRLLRMINELLDASKIEAGRALVMDFKPVNLRELIERVVSTHKTYSERHQLEVNLPEGLPIVEADEDRIYQVLSNLLSNAVKYSPQGGSIRINGKLEDSQVILSVEDQGIGMTEEQIAQLFQRYQRIETKATRRIIGTGLGLYLTKYLVEAHGGRIWVESKLGEGSKFFFSLPFTQDRK